jgi:hypothetical protein
VPGGAIAGRLPANAAGDRSRASLRPIRRDSRSAGPPVLMSLCRHNSRFPTCGPAGGRSRYATATSNSRSKRLLCRVPRWSPVTLRETKGGPKNV